jgi:hypothetical protein
VTIDFGFNGTFLDPHLAAAKGAALFALMKKVKVSMPGEGDPRGQLPPQSMRHG